MSINNNIISDKLSEEISPQSSPESTLTITNKELSMVENKQKEEEKKTLAEHIESLNFSEMEKIREERRNNEILILKEEFQVLKETLIKKEIIIEKLSTEIDFLRLENNELRNIDRNFSQLERNQSFEDFLENEHEREHSQNYQNNESLNHIMEEISSNIETPTTNTPTNSYSAINLSVYSSIGEIAKTESILYEPINYNYESEYQEDHEEEKNHALLHITTCEFVPPQKRYIKISRISRIHSIQIQIENPQAKTSEEFPIENNKLKDE